MAKSKIKDDFTDDDKVGDISFWDYEENNELIGKFVGFQEDKYGQHAIVNDGENEVHLPNLTALETNLKRADKGDKVKIVYKGEETAKESGRKYKDFDVFIKKQ